MSLSQREIQTGKTIGGLWFRSLWPADIAEFNYQSGLSTLQTWEFIFLDRKRNLIHSFKVYALVHESMINCLMFAEALKGSAVKKANLHSLNSYQLLRHTVVKALMPAELPGYGGSSLTWGLLLYTPAGEGRSFLQFLHWHMMAIWNLYEPGIHTSGKGPVFIAQFISGEMSC